MRTFIRVLLGLVGAILIAALAKKAHVTDLAALAGLPADLMGNRLLQLGESVLLIATQQALYAVPFALVAILIAEVNRLRGWIYYVLVGVFIALGGFAIQFVGQDETRTIVNRLAMQAYALTGIVAGLVYWVLAGRFAGWRRGTALVLARPAPLAKPIPRVEDAVTTTQGGRSPPPPAPSTKPQPAPAKPPSAAKPDAKR